jgi:Flp pilus assembly protein TadG
MTNPTLRSDERGQILVFTAVSLVALMGFTALTIDASFMYDRRNKLYAAADAAAKSAAFAMQRSTSAPNLQTFANHEFAISGFTGMTGNCSATSGTVVCVHNPPLNGPYTGNPHFVEVIASQPSTPTFFGRVLGWLTANPGARAVAGFVNPSACIIINQDLRIGNFQFTLDGCGIQVGENLQGDNPNSEVADPNGANTPPVEVVGDPPGSPCIGYCDQMGDLHLGAAAPTDPLAGKLPTPANPGGCGPATAPVVGPGNPDAWVCFDNISPAVTTLLAGNYYITGTINIDNLRGDDVFLFLANGVPGGRFNVVQQNKFLHLTAHTTGPYAGVVVWQEIANTNPFSCINCPPLGITEPFPPNHFTIEWDGAFYLPGVDQDFKNHMTFTPLNGCALFITRNLNLENGNGGFTNVNCANLFPGAAFLSIAVTE